MNETKNWKQKTFTKCKISTTFHKERFLFLFNFSKILCNKHKGILSTMSYLCSKCTAKTYKMKDFSLANDAETHSSNKEENEKRDFFIYLNANKATKGKYRQAQNQEKQILA
jgi:hypothetical protein